MTHTAYPLSWPPGWPRTNPTRRIRSSFKTTLAKSRTGVENELRLLGARNVTISSDVPIRQDGQPYAVRGADRPDDPGVAVYFTLHGETRCIPCDKWTTVWDNLRAVEKTIAALRGIERWGASEMMHAAFQGFAALPESTTGMGWWTILGVERDDPVDAIERAYRLKLMETHPDKQGGSLEGFHTVQEAFKQFKQERGTVRHVPTI